MNLPSVQLHLQHQQQQQRQARIVDTASPAYSDAVDPAAQLRLEAGDEAEKLRPAAASSIDLPTNSALSIALSPQYLSTCLLTLSVVAAWTAITELCTPTGFEPPQQPSNTAGWARYVMTEEMEHPLDVVPVLSVLMLRHFPPADPGLTQRRGCRAVLSAALTPSSWTMAVVVLFWLRLLNELLKLPYFNSPVLISSRWVALLLGPCVVLLKGVTAAYLLRIFVCTQPHPPRRQAQLQRAVGAGWTGCAVLLLLLAFILSPLYELISLFLPRQIPATYGSPLLDKYGGLVEELMMAALLLLGVAGLIHARGRIAQGGVHNDFFCFVLFAAFQLCLPKYLYEGFMHWLPLYQSCSSPLWVKLAALLLFHLAFFLLQLCLRVLTLLCLPSVHCLPAIFYVQWFEDLMADLTFASVPPFSALFWLNATIATLKALVRDTGAARQLVSRLLRGRGALGRPDDGSTVAVLSQRRTHSSSSAELGRHLLAAESEREELPRSTCAAVLYVRYLQSFELSLSRHQLFLSESCAKCVVAVAVLSQLFRPMNSEQPSGWTLVSDQKLQLLAGMCVLWLVQLLAHIAVLRILQARQQRPMPVQLLTEDDAAESAAETELSDTAHAVPTDGRPKHDGCASCVLSYPNYIAELTAEKRQEERSNAEVAISDGDSGVSSGWLSAVFFPRLPRLVSPLLNYWPAHRWLFICQMLHWIWVTLADNSLAHTTCT